MDNVIDRLWNTETFLAWENHQEGRYEFDGRDVIPMTGGSVAHQDIVFNLRVLLARLLSGTSLRALHEMRLRIGEKVRYPDVLVCDGQIDQARRTLDDAVVVFEVLSDDTEATDGGQKLIDYAQVPSLRHYILVEQTSRAAILYQREAGASWSRHPQTQSGVVLPELDLVLPFDDIYQGLVFPHQV